MDNYKLKEKSYVGKAKLKRIKKRLTIRVTLGTVAICSVAFLVGSNVHTANKENEYIENAFSDDTVNGFDELSDVLNISFKEKYEDTANKFMPYFALVSDYEDAKTKSEKDAIYRELSAGFSDINNGSLKLLKEEIGDNTKTNPSEIKVISDKDIPLDIVLENGKSYYPHGKEEDLADSIVNLQTNFHSGNQEKYVKSVKKVLLNSTKLIEGKEEEKGNSKR